MFATTDSQAAGDSPGVRSRLVELRVRTSLSRHTVRIGPVIVDRRGTAPADRSLDHGVTVVDVVVEIAEQAADLGTIDLTRDRRQQVVPTDLAVGQQVDTRQALLVDDARNGRLVGTLARRPRSRAVMLVQHPPEVDRQRHITDPRIAARERAPKHQRILPRKEKDPVALTGSLTRYQALTAALKFPYSVALYFSTTNSPCIQGWNTHIK